MTTPIVARLTMTRENGQRIIVEVSATPTFHRFYAFYQQQGKKRSTRKFIRWGSRNESLSRVNAHRQVPGLELIALHFKYHQFGSPIKSSRIRFFSKRTYKQLIRMAPDKLGLTRVTALFGKRTQVRRPFTRLTASALAFKPADHTNYFAVSAEASR